MLVVTQSVFGQSSSTWYAKVKTRFSSRIFSSILMLRAPQTNLSQVEVNVEDEHEDEPSFGSEDADVRNHPPALNVEQPLSWLFRMAIQVETFRPQWRYNPESTHWAEKPDPGWQCPVEQPKSALIPILIKNMTPQLAVFVLWAVARYEKNFFIVAVFVLGGPEHEDRDDNMPLGCGPVYNIYSVGAGSCSV